MKKIIYLLLISVLLTACKKKKNVNPQPVDPQFANQNCQISKIEFGERSENGTLTFNYDDKGNLVKVDINDKSEDHQSHTYTYSKQRIVSKETMFGYDITTTITYTLDDSDKIISAEEIVSRATAGATTENITYKYTGDGYLSDIIRQHKTKDYDHVAKSTYTWQNGNLTSIKEQSSTSNSPFSLDETESYEYGTDVWPVTFPFLPQRVNGYNTDPFLRKYFGKLPKNLISSITVVGENINRATRKEEYAYQKDGKGNITKVSSVYKTPKEKDKSYFTICRYNCK